MHISVNLPLLMLNIVSITILILVIVFGFSSLSNKAIGTTPVVSGLSISIPGGSTLSNDDNSIAVKDVSMPSNPLTGLGLSNDRGFFGNIRELVGNISSIISGIGDMGCALDSIRGGSGQVEKENHLSIGTSCDDAVKSGNEDDIIYANGGDDVIYSEDGNDLVFAGGGNDRMYGGNDDDLLIGGLGNNLIDGGKGDDVLLAGGGDSLLIGGDGNDKLFAGLSSTVMYGGAGANTFDCPLPAAGLARSIVMDYNPTNGDTLSGPCKVLNTIEDGNGGDTANPVLPDTGEGDPQGNTP